MSSTKMYDVAIYHAADGESWSSYLAAKLKSEEYNVPVRTEMLSAEDQHFSAQCSVQVVLMTPNLLTNTKENKNSLYELLPGRCVVVLLGVDKVDVGETLGDGEEKDSLFECRVQLVNNDSESVRNTIVAIIETYEDYLPVENDDVYSVPPPPKQINSIFQVVPKQVQQGDNLFLFLERKSEKSVTIRYEDLDDEIQTDSLDKAVYCCKVPDTVEGEIELRVESGGQSIGTENVIVKSKLQTLKSLLEDVCNPVELMCQALGLSTATTEALDEALLKRLKMKSRSDLFSALMEDLRVTDENTRTTWPTLLHFAAAYNLEKLTEELLKYPAMILAACTENCRREYPSTIAEKNGFKRLEKKLVDFVLKQKDSGISFDIENPTPHFPSTPDYINTLADDDDEAPDYVDMDQHHKPDYINMLNSLKANSGKYGAQLKNIKAQLFATKKSYSENDAYQITFDNSEEGVEDIRPPFENLMGLHPEPTLPTKTKIDRLSGISCIQDDDDIYHTPPPPSPVIERKISEVQESPPFIDTSENSVEPSSPVQVEVTHASPPPCRSNCHLQVPNMPLESPSSETSSNMDSESIYQDNISVKSGKHDKRGSSVHSLISSFLRRLKRPRFNSSGDVHRGRKTKFYTRSDPGFDDPSVAASVSSMAKNNAGPTSPEEARDSGSYSEEEEDKKPTASNKGNRRGKSKNSGLSREKSVRVHRALKDDTRGAPSVPGKS